MTLHLYIAIGLVKNDGPVGEVTRGCIVAESEDEARGSHVKWIIENCAGGLIQAVDVFMVPDDIIDDIASQSTLRPTVTNTNEKSGATPLTATEMMLNVLRVTPAGLTAPTLYDVLVQQGVPADDAGKAIRTALERDIVNFGANMYIVMSS